MFSFLQKKQIDRENKEAFAQQQAEALERGKKLEAFIIEVMEVAVKHDVTVNDFKLLLNQVAQQLEMAFDSRKVTDFMDKEDLDAVKAKQAPSAESSS